MGGVRPSPFAAAAAKPAPPRPAQHGGHPRASPEVSQAVLQALDAGQSISAAARAGKVSRTAVRGIWARAGHPWPPPGAGRGSGRGRPPAVPLTADQVAEALELRGERQANGRWQHPVAAIAAELGVSPWALYRALARATKSKTSSEEERP